MDDIQQQIQTLKLEIAEHEKTFSILSSEVQDIEAELTEFKKRYDRLVEPIAGRIRFVKEAIAELEEKRKQKVMRQAGWNPPEGYVSIEEQWRRKWQKPREEAQYRAESHEVPLVKPELPPGPVNKDLQKLYRELARRYHPDIATGEDDRKYRTKLMAQINAAYADKDLEALQSLATNPGRINADEPLAVLLLRQLEQTSRMLRQQIFDLKQQRHNLIHCDLMKLKIEEKLLRRQGRDLLKELAADWEATYRALLQKLYELRQEVE